MGQRRTFRSKQTDAGDASRVAVLTFAPTTSIDDPISTAVTPVTTDGNTLDTGTTGSVTAEHFTGTDGARFIAPANPKRVALEVASESGTVRLHYTNAVSSTVGRKLFATSVRDFGRGPGVWQ